MKEICRNCHAEYERHNAAGKCLRYIGTDVNTSWSPMPNLLPSAVEEPSAKVWRVAERLDDICNTENFGESYALAEKLIAAYPESFPSVAAVEEGGQSVAPSDPCEMNDAQFDLDQCVHGFMECTACNFHGAAAPSDDKEEIARLKELVRGYRTKSSGHRWCKEGPVETRCSLCKQADILAPSEGEK